MPTEAKDPDDFDSLAPDVDALIAAWLDRGASPQGIWSILASAVITIARDNEASKEHFMSALSEGWEHADD